MENNFKVHSIKYNAVMNFILTASNFIFPLITFPYVSRVLQASGNGKIAFAASIANYFALVASLGIPSYGVRACAKVRDDRDKLSKTAQEILIINFVSTIITTVTYVICIFLVPDFRNEKALFLINAINVFLNMFGANWIYQALEQYDYITFRNIAFKVISIIMMFLLVRSSGDYVIYGSITVFASVGSNVLNFLRLPKFINIKRYGDYHFKQHLKPIFILFAQSLAINVYTNLDTAMLGFMKSSEEVGFYSAAIKMENIEVSLVAALGGVLLPRMSLYVAKGDRANFDKTLNLGLNFTMCLGAAVTAYSVAESADIIMLLAGSGYEPAIPVMQIISFAVFFNGIATILSTQILVPLERESVALVATIIGALVDFFMNLFLIPLYGASGAAFSTVLTEVVVGAIEAIAARQILSRNKKTLHPVRYVVIGIISAVVCFGVGHVCQSINILVRILVTFVVFDVVFVAILFVVRDGFSKDVVSFVRRKSK